jgi:hypothetical protein
VIVGRLDKRTAKTFMRALYMVVSHVLTDEFSQVRLAERDDAVETVLLDRADKAFDERVQVGTATRQANRFRSGVPEHGPNADSELPRRAPRFRFHGAILLRTTAATLLRGALKVLESAKYPTIQFRHITRSTNSF